MADDKKLNEQDVAKAKAFIQANSKQNERGDSRSMTQTSYLNYFENERSIPPETLKAIAHGERDLIAAATQVATEDLSALITKAKKNGDDPTELEAYIRISRPNGPLTVEVKAQTVSQRPVRPGEEVGPDGPEKIIKHGTVNVKARLKAMIDPNAAAETASIIGNLLA